MHVLAELCRSHMASSSSASATAPRPARPTGWRLNLISGIPNCGCKTWWCQEAGASVYSASELAAREFPDLDVSLRGAVSIARRLQDPLAELVKIEPKAIGVGQYQHDVNQARLSRAPGAVVEDCVNAVGVDVNTASVPAAGAGLRPEPLPWRRNIVEIPRRERPVPPTAQQLREGAAAGRQDL